MSRAGPSSDPPAGDRQSITGGRSDDKKRNTPLGLIIYRVGLPFRDPDLTDDAAGITDECMEEENSKADKNEKGDDSSGYHRNKKKQE